MEKLETELPTAGSEPEAEPQDGPQVTSRLGPVRSGDGRTKSRFEGYVEHPSLPFENDSQEKVNLRRLGVSVLEDGGFRLPGATWSLEAACLPEWIRKPLFGNQPTPLQAVTWPLLRTNRDVVAIAEPGCGKTLAYAVPLLIRAAALQGARHEQPDWWQQKAWQEWRQRPPDGVILVPTSEVAQQVQEQIKPLASAGRVQVAGGTAEIGAEAQEKELSRAGVLVLTPWQLQCQSWALGKDEDLVVGAAIAGVAARRFRTSVGAKPSWQQSMLRIKDPEKSLDFYRDKMGMRLIDKLDFESMAFSLYFLASVPAEEKTPEPGTSEAHQYLWTFPGTTLELTHNYGSEKEAGAIYHPGNEPQEGNKRDGFGHVAFSVHDVYEFSDELQKSGVKFQKKLDEGRMKGLAFALDPDGYWVELLRGGVKGRNTLAQTMLRVKDPKKSLDFYTKHMGMTLLTHHDYDDFSLYYLGTIPEGATEFPDDRPVLELTHNHGTENDADFQHYNGNEAERKGFGHVGFLVDDVYETCKELEEAGYAMQKAPDAGSMKGLAFARDPDGYWDVVIIFDEADDIIKDGDDEGTQARTVLDFMPKNRVLGFFSATWPRRTHEMARRHLRHDAVMVYATTECESNAAGCSARVLDALRSRFQFATLKRAQRNHHRLHISTY
ncbi:unnamed protein product [Durusdinium trenchii]|uniref:Lactoylglutathione lyase n=1 Tax=Durusdinium trenchii TaxID=1381693 RepID=A0ABP0KHQ0_9DINO